MRVPTIHLNGTSREELCKQLQEAHAALSEAMGKLAAACPNGRDYYPQGDTAHREAMAEHKSRVDRVASVLLEIENIYMEVEG